jgi:HK97 family phage major capsid protein
MDITTLQQEIKTLSTELKSAVGEHAKTLTGRIDELQKQVDAIDSKAADNVRNSGSFADVELKKILEENDGVSRLLHDRKGSAVITIPAHVLETKTTVTSAAVGASTSGVLQIDRSGGIVPEARQVLRVRQLLPSRPTSLQIVDFLKVNTPMSNASPQVEGDAKHENAVTFTTASEKVKTIATWIPATKQVIDDLAELLAFLQGSLGYYVDMEEELQILSGDNTGENLHGLIPQADDFDATLLAGGWNYIDVIGWAAAQIARGKEIAPSFVILNPIDWWKIRLTKDSFGRYVLGDPMGPVNNQALFGLIPVPTTNITAGTFLVGNGEPAAVEIRDRQELTVEISTQHANFFVENKIAVRAEKRLALLCKRPDSFVTGSFSQSPA